MLPKSLNKAYLDIAKNYLENIRFQVSSCFIFSCFGTKFTIWKKKPKKFLNFTAGRENNL
jgi:hypothetical protein